MMKHRSNATLKSDGIFSPKNPIRLEWLWISGGDVFPIIFRMIWSKSVKVSKGLNVWADSGRSSLLDYPFLNGSFLPQGRVPGKWYIYRPTIVSHKNKQNVGKYIPVAWIRHGYNKINSSTNCLNDLRKDGINRVSWFWCWWGII